MNSWKSLCSLSLLACCATTALAQPPVQQLQRELAELRRQMKEQRDSFEKRLSDLQASLADSMSEALEDQIEEIVATKSMFFARPKVRTNEPQRLFDSLQGGLIFTGLFRARFEYRRANLDFKRSGGLDDEGVRINGRFRLGFGAVLLNAQTGDDKDPQIKVLTEFQAVGTFANNSFANVPGPGGTPLPTAFNILTEPFEEVALYQGYLSFERVIHDNIYLKIGRQEITFGNEFIMGNNSFFDGTVHDALLLEWIQADLRASLFYAKEAASDTNLVTGIDDFDEDEIAGAYVSWHPAEDMILEAYAVYFNARSVASNLFVTGSTAFFFDGAVNPILQGTFWTLGARFFATHLDLLGGELSLNAEAAFQTGSNSPGGASAQRSQEIRGIGAEFIANWRMSSEDENSVRPILTLAYYFAEGGDNGSNSGGPKRRIGFQPLFINRHFDLRDRDDALQPYFPGGGRYGNMDIIPLSNVHLARIAFSIAPSDKTEVGLGYVLAITADDEGFGTGIFGHEFDVFGSYQYNEFVQFSANFSIFFPGDTARDLSTLLFFAPGSGDRAGESLALAFYMQALISF